MQSGFQRSNSYIHLDLRASFVKVVLMLNVLLQSGAKHVYGVECSAIADQAKRIVADNGYADRVTIIKGKVRILTVHLYFLCPSLTHWLTQYLPILCCAITD